MLLNFFDEGANTTCRPSATESCLGRPRARGRRDPGFLWDFQPVPIAYRSVFLPSAVGYGAASAQESAQSPKPPETQLPVSTYDKAIFQNPIPSDQLGFLNQFAGAPANEVVRDKQFHKLTRSVIPNCIFHYGTDMSLSDALDLVLKGSPVPVRLREGRYVTISGRNGPYLMGRGFLWFDLQDGIVLGGFYFHPTNGEPTPTVTIFSRQVKEESLHPRTSGDLHHKVGVLIRIR
jgi:hypothetical protein